jgi:hypothetical protein
MVGAIAHGFHEGSRSEYFAQCVFSAFGTSVPVPHPEDHGIDFYCTLTDRIGQRSWATASYTVQVKSEPTWVLEGRESVEWFIKHPLPLFLGVMDKKLLTLRICHTAPRSYVWATGELPDRVEITVTNDTVGQSIQLVDGYKFDLPPILCIEMQKLASDDRYHDNVRKILEFWIGVDNRNIMRIKTGIYGWEMPDSYEVNVIPKTGRVMQWRTTQSEELLDNVVRQLCDCLEFLGGQFRNTGKFVAAAEVALLHRYLHQNCSVFSGDERIATGGALSFVSRA